MADKFFGVWLPGRGWVRMKRGNANQGFDMVAWATTELPMARWVAGVLGGEVRRIDEALGSADGEAYFKEAEKNASAKGKVTIWQRIKKLLHLDTSTI
jgi:hypothetical protein